MKLIKLMLSLFMILSMNSIVHANDINCEYNTISIYNDKLYAITKDGILLQIDFTEQNRTDAILENVISVSGNYAIKEDGSLWTWDEFLHDENNDNDVSAPVKVMENVKSVSSGGNHTLIVNNDGTLWGIGSNNYGQLAQGDMRLDYETQIKMCGKEGYVFVDCTPQYFDYPVLIMDDVAVAKAGGLHSIVLKQDGSVWTFGSNVYGQLGDGKIINKDCIWVNLINNSPAKIMNYADRIYAGSTSGYAVDSDNILWRWGSLTGELIGVGGKYMHFSPIEYAQNAKNVVTQQFYTLVLKEDETLWALGETEETEEDIYVLFKDSAHIPVPKKISDNVNYIANDVIDNDKQKKAAILKNNGEVYIFELTDEIQEYKLTKITDGIRLYDSAFDDYKKIKVLASVNGIDIELNGEKIAFHDTRPYVDENNRTQIPVRDFAELLAFDVNWDSDAVTVILTKNDISIKIKIGESEIIKNGKTIIMDTSAKIVNDRTYIPLRFISEAFGYSVEWE